MLRRLGTLLYVVGVLLLAHVGVVAGRGWMARARARSAWEAGEARLAVAHVTAALASSAPTPAPRAGAPVARIAIPRIGVDEIVVEGVDGDELNAGPGHLPGSALPGADGNAIVSAHRDRHFHGLDELVLGDTILTESAAGRIEWTVTGRRVVERGAPALFTTGDATLTLTTCWPVRYVGPAPERLILTAKPIRRLPQA
ncbi:MAG: class D sortase [Gemmatimonadota bacterium]|nr:class D sortase [Gemmatimonadota bacterium]